MSQVFSHSRLSTYENCPRQFRYRYVDKLPATWESIEAFVGKRVHEVIERLSLFVSGGRIPRLPSVVSRYRQMFDAAYDPDRVKVVREGTEVAAYKLMGERCLTTHYLGQYPFDADETLAVEQRVACDLDAGGRYKLQGFVDRLARAPDGVVEIHDYKTGKRMPNQKQLDQDRQLALYQLALRDRHRDAPGFRLVWHFLRYGKRRISTRTPEQLDALRASVVDLIQTIEREEAFEARVGPLCGWCEYREICSASPHYAPEVAAAAPPPAAAKSAAQTAGGASHSPGRRPPPPGSGQLSLFAATGGGEPGV